MKVAPVMEALRAAGGSGKLVHTGQHYDFAMSDVFFTDLGMPRPDIFLGVGSGSHAEQTARVMIGFEQVCAEERPRRVVVAGDVNSTLACALVAAKLQIPCAHIEAGLRSFDMAMPEEINRVLTDRICDLLLTPSPDADANLLREGTPYERIHQVGNVMIDSLLAHLPKARAQEVPRHLGLTPGAYAVLTLHRVSNVDDPETLGRLLSGVAAVLERIPVVFPVHPRTRQSLERHPEWQRLQDEPGLHVHPPMGYLDFLGLTSEAKLVLTDSGGLQEETTALGIPCLTLRDNTERPITVEEGTNTLVGSDPDRIVEATDAILRGAGKSGRVPALWDGQTGPRIAQLLR